MKCPNCFALEQELQNLKKNVIQLEGWKGKDQIEIEPISLGWKVTEHSKSKESGKVRNLPHIVTTLRVEGILNMITQFFAKAQDKIKARELWEIIINFYDLPLKVDEFNGGKNRKTYYLYYYMPIKVLEYLKKINYSGRGVITKGVNY
jgi:hypothetical protein